MTARLLCHDPNTPGAVSPFDAAIISIAKGHRVCLACPYLGLAYLYRIISLSRSWRLLTDVEAWLLSQNRSQRAIVYEFLVRNRAKVRHYPQLHAKVVIGPKAAMLGSANLTDQGIRRRTEVSVLLEDDPQVRELDTWFETHWSRAYELPLDEIVEYMKSLPERAVVEGSNDSELLPSLLTKPASLVKFPGSNKEGESIPDDSTAHERLIQRVAMAASRSWLEGYLDLVKFLIEDLALESSDPRLAMSIPKSGSYLLPVSINNRYVIAPENKKGEAVIGFIFGADFERRHELKSEVVRYGQFKALPGENAENVPFYLRVRSARDVLENDELRLGWLEAARCELDRGQASTYRRHHVPACYRLAVDLAYRKKVLAKGVSSVPVD